MRRFVFLFLILLLSACESQQQELSIPFAVQFDGQPVRCDDGLPVTMTDLRFFAYDVEFLDASGSAIAARIVRDGAWQSGKVAMIDLETGAGACDDGTTAFFLLTMMAFMDVLVGTVVTIVTARRDIGVEPGAFSPGNR